MNITLPLELVRAIIDELCDGGDGCCDQATLRVVLEKAVAEQTCKPWNSVDNVYGEKAPMAGAPNPPGEKQENTMSDLPVVVYKPIPRREPQMSGVNCPSCGTFMEHARSSFERMGCGTTDPVLIYHPTWTEQWERPGEKCYSCGKPFPESWVVDRGEFKPTPSAFDAECGRRAEVLLKAEKAGLPPPEFPPMPFSGRMGGWHERT